LLSDRHRLSDRGLVTIESHRFTFRASDRIRTEPSNGRLAIELEGKRRIVRPELPDERQNGVHHQSAVNRPEG